MYNWILTKIQRQFKGERIVFSINCAEKNGYQGAKYECQSITCPIYKN